MTGSASTHEHRTAAAEGEAPRCAVVTISDSRTVATDASGDLIAQLLGDAGFTVARRELLPNDASRIAAVAADVLADPSIDALLCTGGTGLGARDLTVDVIRPMLQRELPGFGELFRMLSYQEQIGAAAMLSRAVAGATNGTFVAVMPGSKAACELAMTKLIVPELKHALREIRR